MPFLDFTAQLTTLFKNLTPGKRITLVFLVMVTVLGFVFLISWSGNPDFQILYSNLSPEDAGNIVLKLKEERIPYKISFNGNSILIPEERIYEIRLQLASQGLPQGGGVGFEVFDNTKLGMTEFVQNVNYQRALQGELARTINGLIEIESSRVHIVMPSKSLFIDEEEPATASVVLKLRPGRFLNKDQIQGVIHLVSSSVSGLKPEDVMIVDNYGKMLSGVKGTSLLGQFTSDQLELQDKIEQGLEKRITTMLEAVLGNEKAIVRVSCLLDFKRLEKTEERYDPANIVVRSEQIFNENSKGTGLTSMGIPGVESNLAEETKPTEIGSSNSGFQKQDKTVNYEIGKVTSHIVEPVGKVERISVAVMVDGIYKMIKGKDGREERKYFSRGQEEMEKLENLVKTAVSFDASRGDNVEVMNAPFESTKVLPEDQRGKGTGSEGLSWTTYLKYLKPIIKAGFLVTFLLLSFIFVVRPVVAWITTSPGRSELLTQLPKTVSEIEKEYGGEVKSLPFRDRASDIIRNNREGSVQLMKDWLKGS